MKETSNLDNLELYNRLSTVSSKVLKNKDETRILDSLGVKKPNLFAFLDLIYLLIDGESKLAKTFWDAFVRAQAFYTQLDHVFDIKQLAALLKLASENKEKQDTEDSKELFESLKEFIAINGLVQKCSEEQIEFKESLDMQGKAKMHQGAVAEIKIEEKFKNKIINKHKQLLLEGVLIIHGVTSSIHTNFNFDHSEPPTIEIRDLLSRNNLVRNFDHLVKADKEYFDAFMRRRGPSYENLMEHYEWKETEEFPDGTVWEKGSTERYFHDREITIHTIRNFVNQAKLVTNQLNLFSNLMDDFNKESIRTRPKFNDFLEESGKSHNFKIPKDFDVKVKKALSKLSEILIARTLLEEKNLYYEDVVLYPGNTKEYPTEWHEDPETGEMWEGAPEPTFLHIPIRTLASIAMLKESKSIRNEMFKEDSILEYGDEGEGEIKDSVTIYSAYKWLKDSKRKYPFFKLIERNKLTDQKITLFNLRTLHKANEA